MNVQELINLLEEFPKEALVVMSGFEGGFNEIKNVKFPLNIKLNVSQSWLEGPHKETDKNSADISAVLIGERRR